MAPKSGEDDRQGIQSVEIAMTVLGAIERGRGPMSLSQIAAGADMATSKAHRYLVSLSRAGLVAQARSSGLYDLGPAARRLGVESLRRMDEVGLASEYLPELRDRTSHAVNLAVWGDHGPVLVRWEYGVHPLPITIRIGATMPLTTSSVGLVFLAHLPSALTAPLLTPGFDAATARRTVLDNGFAHTSEAMIPGVTSLAAVVLTASLPLAVALALPSRTDADELKAITADLVETTRRMSAELGGGH
ncbi:IclR family transcriptional regulator [Kutzneria chonburiensis]|uniref:IclR family transcriptional regulator n=1 Tax=Kutzneria chonburiensis TaxID=1483604 RepID=A0ABV6MM87_9PSEU|nr:IclR family transcriptional regulator [Kutzneria chonburiensis]